MELDNELIVHYLNHLLALGVQMLDVVLTEIGRALAVLALALALTRPEPVKLLLDLGLVLPVRGLRVIGVLLAVLAVVVLIRFFQRCLPRRLLGRQRVHWYHCGLYHAMPIQGLVDPQRARHWSGSLGVHHTNITTTGNVASRGHCHKPRAGAHLRKSTGRLLRRHATLGRRDFNFVLDREPPLARRRKHQRQ